MSLENKIGDVVVLKTETQQQAFYQLADGTSVFLCAVALEDYENTPLRQRFFDLATEIVLARIRATGSNVTLVQRDPSPPPEAKTNAGLPCWSCASPTAADVRDWLRSSSEQDVAGHRSPSGLPLICCRVVAVGAFGAVGAGVGR
jgi:hypothetical protein